uniref:Cilia- and flagella-associated protein 418 n=1 Tax=Coturnix japonica TaxID=93934 RepID=A0A8C2SMR9_COTJA
MADELDRLLDEVERRFCLVPERGEAGGDQNQHTERAAAGRSAEVLMGAGSDEDDIDDIIDEICNDSSFARTPVKLKSDSPSVTPGSNSAVVQAHRKRCCPVYLGGSSSPNGIGTNISKRTCDQLRCTACDFRVSLFNDYIWDQSCDYLFFRSEDTVSSVITWESLLEEGCSIPPSAFMPFHFFLHHPHSPLLKSTQVW